MLLPSHSVLRTCAESQDCASPERRRTLRNKNQCKLDMLCGDCGSCPWFRRQRIPGVEYFHAGFSKSTCSHRACGQDRASRRAQSGTYHDASLQEVDVSV
eukprot:3144627-Rhodomonas_salina.1